MDRKTKKGIVGVLTGAALFVAALLIPAKGLWKAAMFLAVYLYIGWDVLFSAGRNILRGQVFDENFLMSVASIGAFCIGEYPEAVFVMLFSRIGELFEHYAVGSSRKSIAGLMEIRPDTANLDRDGEIIETDPEEISVGDIILVRPGERIPLDGTVLEGSSALNTTALTGESVPRDVKAGDAVVSGCINMSAVLRIRVDKVFSESTASRILELVETSSMNKAKTENFITRFARIYTPAVVGCALALAVIPTLITGGFTDWLHRALVFLVVSCPCALVISVPLSFFGGIGAMSRQGILVKGSNYMEALAAVRTIAFDKTGTLTNGSFQVTETYPADCGTKALINAAAMAECHSSHPIAVSIRQAADPVDPRRTSDVTEVPGMGVRAAVDGHAVLVGKRDLLISEGIADVPRIQSAGTVTYVSMDGRYLGAINVSDSLKSNAEKALKDLRCLGIQTLVMLTGDSDSVGRDVSERLGLDGYHAELLPAEKVVQVEALLDECRGGSKLAFVGDGINDAPVLTRADVGIAMGALGSDAAIEAADVVLMDDNLEKLPLAIRTARRTHIIVRQNIIFALGVKMTVLILSALGYTGMWAASFADVGVSVLAILNAMRCLKVK